MKKIKYWVAKIFFITLVISAGVSVAVEYFVSNMSLAIALLVLLIIVLVGIIFDIVGVAFASADQEPFMAMSAKKNKEAHQALKMLKNADIVSSFCNDVIGDICGIVSGAAGAAITLKALVIQPEMSEFFVSIAVSSLIAACTVAGKAAGKNIAFKKSKEIVLAIGSIMHFFSFKKDTNKGKK